MAKAIYVGAPTETQLLSSLPIGSLVKDPNSTFLGKPIIWKIADKNHTGYPSGAVTLITEKMVALRCFDAKEPNNSDSRRKNYGNERYALSNIRQWLNSSAGAGQWYSAQHSADAAPNSSNVWPKNGVAVNPYDTDAGFLNGFSENFKNALLETSLIVAKPSTDGGGSETVTDKLFLASNTEVGLANENNIAEGSVFPIFSNSASRITSVTAEGLDDSDYADDPAVGSEWHWWLRTPYVHTSSSNARHVNNTGDLSYNIASVGHYGVRPLCNLPSSILVSPTTDSDGCYRLFLPISYVAKSVKNMYVGVDGKARKVKKGYIGVNGIAKQFYSAETLIPFTSNLIPTTWEGSSDGLTATATNNYGQWRVSAPSRHSAGYDIQYAFDYVANNFWRSNGTSYESIYLYCPNGVAIKPKDISIEYARFGSTKSIAGLNADTGAWETLFTLSTSSSVRQIDNFVYEGQAYFSAFRVDGTYQSSSYRDKRVHEFKITSGTLRMS